jgi:large conductance mechanosensitive channel
VIKGFKEFLLRGDVVDLAVAVVIGAAFGAVVSAVVRDLITPIVAAVFGQPDFSSLDFTINGSRFRYGDFLNALITFVSVAAAVYFFVVVPVNALTSMRRRDATVRPCPECLTEIPAKAMRCRACTAAVTPV